MLQLTRTFLLGTWPRPPELQLMLLQTRWRQVPVREEGGVTVPEVSKAAVDVRLSTTAYQRQPSSLYNKQMHHQNQGKAQMTAARLDLAQGQLPPVRFQHVKTAARPLHRFGEGATLVTSFAMLVVSGQLKMLRRERSLITRRSLLQAPRNSPTRCDEETGNQASKTSRPCWRDQLASRAVCCELLAASTHIANAHGISVSRPHRIARAVHTRTSRPSRSRLHPLPQYEQAQCHIKSICAPWRTFSPKAQSQCNHGP